MWHLLMAHQQESFHPFSSRQSLSCFLTHMAKGSTPKLGGPDSHQSCVAPGFKSQCQSSSTGPFPTSPTISYTCEHSRIHPALPGYHSKSGQEWPHGVEPIISKLSRRHCNQGELLPSYILGRSHSHLPGSKHGHRYLTYLCNQLKIIDMLNDHARG